MRPAWASRASLRSFSTRLATDALVLHGRCLSYGEGITYWPIGEAIREAAALDDSDDDETIRAQARRADIR